MISGIAAMRVQVSVLGRFHSMRGIWDLAGALGARVQVIIKSSCQGGADSAHLREVCDARPHDPLQAPEVFQQCATLGGPKSRDHFQHRLVVTPRTLLAMSGNGKAVRLVADTLDEP